MEDSKNIKSKNESYHNYFVLAILSMIIGGVSYIIIGNKLWNGFTESYEQEMINEIKSVSSE